VRAAFVLIQINAKPASCLAPFLRSAAEAAAVVAAALTSSTLSTLALSALLSYSSHSLLKIHHQVQFR